MKPIFLLVFFSTLISSVTGQVFDRQKTVQVQANVQVDPPLIDLQWPSYDDPFAYAVFRKDPDATTWGSALAELDSNATGYQDNSVELGQLYEYLVIRDGASQIGFGFITSGIQVVDIIPNSSIVVVVDTSAIPSNNQFFQQYINDLRHESYRVITMAVNRNDAVVDVKAKIKAAYLNDPDQVKSVLLVGHVPVPYSGDIAPDGHGNHVGAWAADTYYADMDGKWTDNLVNNETAAGTRNDNIPGDLKFDQNVFESLELEVGRVDFANMSLFPETELELLEQYFQKNHAFRMGDFVPKRRGLIENNFAGFDEGFGQNGLRNFPPMFGKDSTAYEDFNSAKSNSYTWVYGCGGGNFQGASGIANTTTMVNDSVEAVFAMMFGSYFGDWDSPNNFLRSALGSGTILSNVWAGRPNFVFHQMAMGKTLGYCVLLSQNNPGGIYVSQFGAHGVHIGLMGDPTLRLFSVPNSIPTNLNAEQTAYGAQVTWDAPTAAITNYALYYKTLQEDNFSLWGDTLIQDRTADFSCLNTGTTYVFMVRSAHLEQSASGTYYNMGPGVSDTFTFTNSTDIVADFSFATNDTGTVTFTNLSDTAISFFWDFGDGSTSSEQNPTHTYENSDVYSVTLYATAMCDTDTTSQIVDIMITALSNKESHEDIRIYPNPASTALIIDGPEEQYTVDLQSLSGVQISSQSCTGKDRIDLSALVSGFYVVIITNQQGRALYRELLLVE